MGAMLSRSIALAAVLVTAPPGAEAADLVVWWEQGFYAQEDEAVREIIAAFEQGSGKQVEITFSPQRELGPLIEAALEAGRPPDFAFGTLLMDYAGEWALDRRLVHLTDTIGSFLNLFDPEALGWVTLLNAKTGQKSLYGLPMEQYRQYIRRAARTSGASGFQCRSTRRTSWTGSWLPARPTP
jgi:multiple sugar transport system substrate-binding protein